MSDAVAHSVTFDEAPAGRSLTEAPLTILAVTLSTYFMIVAFSLYWVTAAAAALLAKVLPRSVIERAPLAWLTGSSILAAAMTQAFPNFWPDYTQPIEIATEVALWLCVGVFARSYLIYTDYPPTFEGLQQSIEARPLERWMSKHLHHPIDAVFTRIWVANSIATIPLTGLLLFPSAINYYVITIYAVALLLTQFPHELIDHTNVHTRVFQPKLGAAPWVRRMLSILNFYYEFVLTTLVARVPGYYRAQHVYIHHVEGNGPRDSQTTEPYDRTSFFDFSRHAFFQGVHLVSGITIWRYLAAKGKKRPMRELARGMAIWWAIMIVLALYNPVAALVVFVTRFVGGNVQSMVAFWQHGLVDPNDSHATYGNTIDFAGPEHGNLGNDYHVEHHDQPGRHWSAYYKVFQSQEHAEGGHPAVVFQKDVFGPLAFVSALWRRDYAALGRHAHIHDVDPTDTDELARVAYDRTRPIGNVERAGYDAAFDKRYSWLMSYTMPTRFNV